VHVAYSNYQLNEERQIKKQMKTWRNVSESQQKTLHLMLKSHSSKISAKYGVSLMTNFGKENY
jgi:hypothetical protein